MPARKMKISVSLDADLVGSVDRLAASEGTTRSSVMERWLYRASRQARAARLEEETASYYDALTPGERADDASWATVSSGAARRMKVDEPPPASPPRRLSA